MRCVLPLLLVVLTSIAAADVTRDGAIAIATDQARSFGIIDVALMDVSADQRTTPPNDALPEFRPRLAHRLFWLVSFTPRKSWRGGAYIVYVASDSGEVLGTLIYK